MSSSSRRSLQFRYGNAYQRLPIQSAKLDRSGKHRKIHDVVLFVDVMDPDEEKCDLIKFVTFELGPTFKPSEFLCHSPVPVNYQNRKIMRFATRQQMYGSVTATIRIQGVGGTSKVLHHSISCSGNVHVSSIQTFHESQSLRPLPMIPLPPNAQFGLELELTSRTSLSPEEIAERLSSRSSDGPITSVRVFDSHRAGRQTLPQGTWKLVPDSSIACNASQPNCNTFELVSPVLKGQHGLKETRKILSSLNSFQGQIQVNKSMGFHVHIDVSRYSVQQLIKICQNFIKYESVMDAMVPVSRRTGSPESNAYFRSNRESITAATGGDCNTDRKRLWALASQCNDISSLAHLMNYSGSRYYKLNLQNLVTGRQPTLEFRQHSATANYEKVDAWVRFCVALCVNSAQLKPPSPLARGKSIEQQLDLLFTYVIKDRALKKYYTNRYWELCNGENGLQDYNHGREYCCSACNGNAGPCERSAKNYRRI